MKKSIFTFLIYLLIASCTNQKWDAAYATKKCIENNKGSMFGEAGIKKLCECMGPKEAAKYKTEKERDNDRNGTDKIIAECELEIITK